MRPRGGSAMTRRSDIYLRSWRATRPAGLFSGEFFSRDATRAMRIHRRAWAGVDRGVVALPTLASQLWVTTKWRVHPPANPPVPAPEALERFAASTGVPVAVQLERLAALRRDPGVPSIEAHLMGLTRDGQMQSWPEFVYSPERYWNISASAVMLADAGAARNAAAVLSDKTATSTLLSKLGLPVVPDIRVSSAAELPGAITTALAKGGGVFAKPQFGSGGLGAATITEADGVLVARSYGGGHHGDPIPPQSIASHLPLLLQPLLRSPGTSESDHDIVTMRIVTRNRGLGPEVFSQVVEQPAPRGYYLRPLVGGELGAALGAAGDEGTVGDDAAANLSGTEGLADATVLAHSNLPGLFAVAWDIALTTDGPVFLEGNTGFSVLPPQMVAGGLLADLE